MKINAHKHFDYGYIQFLAIKLLFMMSLISEQISYCKLKKSLKKDGSVICSDQMVHTNKPCFNIRRTKNNSQPISILMVRSRLNILYPSRISSLSIGTYYHYLAMRTRLIFCYKKADSPELSILFNMMSTINTVLPYFA